ncbi:ParB N-terminal domain-containing protein [Planococcus salinarum]|uniref:ParB N-terminal domain-containing protein n=1 Tax=Planococcus salinarum TaxID=622695 RepID=UPI000E3DC759|nr:ParB N-terminal domain-containing protein [Planococcus salinarum]TAA72839.1 hypothetical protein D2909_04410 [Planococcus salinarum]
MKKMKANPDFIPCLPVPGDEMLGGFPFNWHISKAAAWIEENPGQVELSVVQVGAPGPLADSSNLDEEFIPQADLTKPLIMVRMRPEFFRLIDGNHRVAKARRLGVKELPAYYLTQEQHRQFFTSKDMDERYVGYWNGKLKDFKRDKGRWGVVGEVEV